MAKLMFDVLIVAIVCVQLTKSATSPSIESGPDGGLTLTVKKDTAINVRYIESDGTLSEPTTLVTQEALAAANTDMETATRTLAQSMEVTTETIFQSIQNLNTSKESVVASASASKAIQAEISSLLTSLAKLEQAQNLSSQVDIQQAACHAQGKLYNPTSQTCQLAVTVNCPSTIDTDARLNSKGADCDGTHYVDNKCVVACADGFSGDDLNFVCKIDTTWAYEFNGPVPGCVDINECNASPCKQNQKCTNFAGSYECTCNTGYYLIGDGSCKAVDQSSIVMSYDVDKTVRKWTVPPGITTLQVIVKGSGGVTAYVQPGGVGALVQAVLRVSPGDNLTIAIGGPGTGVGAGKTNSLTMGDPSYKHGGGGGLVGIFLGDIQQSNALVVAGSGGGGGSNRAARGGNGGGDTGEPGQAIGVGALSGPTRQCTGHGGDNQRSHGGQGGGVQDIKGSDGGPLLAGSAGSYGSAGGVGYFGGGGGGHCPNICGCAGGGGTSFVTPAAVSKIVQGGSGAAADVGGSIIIAPKP